MTTLPMPTGAPAGESAPRMFYGKPLTFEHRRHMYFWGERHVPSVTSIIGRLDKPGLIWWAAEEAVKHLREAWERNKAVLHDASIWEDARKAHDRIKRTAGDIGSVLHDIACDVQSSGFAGQRIETLPEESRPIATRCAGSLLEWLGAQKFGFADLERMIFSREMMYAGRTDRFGVINDRLAVLDYKSGGEKVYPETWLQLSGYELALREELGVTEPIWHYVIHISKKTGRLTPNIRGPEHTAPAKEAWRRLVAFDAAMRAVPSDAQVAKAA